MKPGHCDPVAPGKRETYLNASTSISNVSPPVALSAAVLAASATWSRTVPQTVVVGMMVYLFARLLLPCFLFASSEDGWRVRVWVTGKV